MAVSTLKGRRVLGSFSYPISETVSIQSSTHTLLGSFKPPRGVYLILCIVDFQSNNSGARYIYGNVDNSNNPNSLMQKDERPASSNPCRYQQAYYFDGNTTYYVKGRQTSGATLTATVRAMFVRLGDDFEDY